jgi:hypothetical protein
MRGRKHKVKAKIKSGPRVKSRTGSLFEFSEIIYKGPAFVIFGDGFAESRHFISAGGDFIENLAIGL